VEPRKTLKHSALSQARLIFLGVSARRHAQDVSLHEQLRHA
jgi:hypothetical protein